MGKLKIEILPAVVFLSIAGWFLNDPATTTQSLIILIYGFATLIIFTRKILPFNRLTILLFLSPLIYCLSALVNHQYFIDFFQGTYGRNTGIVFLVSIIIIFQISTNGNLDSDKIIERIGLFLAIPIIIVGLFQAFGLNPIPWQKNKPNEIMLTLGNSNFAGALLGLVSIFLFYKIVKSSGNIQKISVLLWLLILFLTIKTSTLQSLVIILLAPLLYLYFNSFPNKKGNFQKSRFIGFSGLFAITFFILSTILISNFDYLKLLREKLYGAGSVAPRIEYWKMGLRIFKDHPIFGIGIDNIVSYATTYRSASLVGIDSSTVIPDKSHNTLIDHFVNGGIFNGIIWMVFYISISYFGIRNILNADSSREKKLNSILMTSWVFYLFQSFISPDALLLILLGMIVAGRIVAETNLKSLKPKLVNNSEVRLISLVRLTSIALLVGFIFIAANQIRADYRLLRFQKADTLTIEELNKVTYDWPNKRALEFVAFKVGEDYGKCPLTIQISDELVRISPRSGQGWYFKALCLHYQGKLKESLENLDRAIKYDPINPTYLFALAQIQNQIGEISEAKKTIDFLNNTYKDRPDLIEFTSKLFNKP